VLTAVAAAHLRPDVSLFVGVGGGVKDVKLGDVVVATKVYGYEAGKATGSGFLPRAEVGRGTHALTQRARAMRKRNEWRARLSAALRKTKPNLLVEPIAAGEKVVASQRSEAAKFIKKQYSDAVAVEMEGRGFLEAAHVQSTVAVVIRGISDLLSKKGTADKKGWQKKAAATASAVAFEMLHKLHSAKPLTARQAKAPSSARLPKSKKAKLSPARKPRQDRAARAADPTAASPASVTATPAATPFRRMPYTLNEGAFYVQGEEYSPASACPTSMRCNSRFRSRQMASSASSRVSRNASPFRSPRSL